jgi:two-component system cell cycle sensor histidine kinase/response regulator CckA
VLADGDESSDHADATAPAHAQALTFTALVESPDAMLLLDHDGVVRVANRAAERLFHRELAGMRFAALLGDEALAAEETNRGDTGRMLRLATSLPDGTRLPLEVSLSPLGTAPDSGQLAVCRDASDRERLEAQLRQAQKMEAIGRLAGGIAHDLNNVLTVVRSFGELALEEIDPTSPAHDHLTQVLHAAARSAKLTRQLLAFSRRQPVVARVVTFNDVVRDTEMMLRRAAGEDVEFHIERHPDAWPILVDPSHFEQVLLNLVVNARDAMEKGGSLTITTDNVELDDEYARAHAVALPAGPYAMLSVTDTGTGMTEEVRGRIFEPFFTTKDSEKGTGLGLSTCYGIVKQAGGVIWVYSELGIGTAFKIYVPRTQVAADPKVGTGTTLRRIGGHETLLVVEDDSQVRRVLADTLTREGYRVVVAQNGLDALRLAEEDVGRFDMLVTDVVMPKMGGPELAERLRLVRSDLPVLFLTGYSEHAVVQHGVPQAGAFSLLEKPFSRQRLLERVRSILDGHVRAG